MNITHEFYSDDQHTQHEHYIDIVNTLFKFSNGDAVNAFKFSMNSNEVREPSPARTPICCPVQPMCVSGDLVAVVAGGLLLAAQTLATPSFYV